jgi:hypothetical protein
MEFDNATNLDRKPVYVGRKKKGPLMKAAWSFLIPLSPTGNPGEAPPAIAFAAEVSAVAPFWESNGNPSS